MIINNGIRSILLTAIPFGDTFQRQAPISQNVMRSGMVSTYLDTDRLTTEIRTFSATYTVCRNTEDLVTFLMESLGKAIDIDGEVAIILNPEAIITEIRDSRFTFELQALMVET